MEYETLVRRTDTPDGKLVTFGPLDTETGWQLAIPATFERQVESLSTGKFLTLSCQFDGERIEVTKLLVESSGIDFIETRDLFKLKIPQLIRQVARTVIPDAERWVGEVALQSGGSKHVYLAQMYWYEYATHGTPRLALMDHLTMKRSTCNVLIRKLRAEYGLPEATASEE